MVESPSISIVSGRVLHSEEIITSQQKRNVSSNMTKDFFIRTDQHGNSREWDRLSSIYHFEINPKELSDTRELRKSRGNGASNFIVTYRYPFVEWSRTCWMFDSLRRWNWSNRCIRTFLDWRTMLLIVLNQRCRDRKRQARRWMDLLLVCRGPSPVSRRRRRVWNDFWSLFPFEIE